eukprot:CAMPEP_0196998582 /NCGR_PEP_ID=MMETSP1380-20130617/3931_1 /TAXON_ID=5936 /ORGANISM="Euplotes crassus, Strain CT5" /LENGTH=633 /DNA_ID=CAMNT_0042415199 /DNA_START=28 /DNA_END=1929 /DNA_ORIENTATION=-
MSYNKAPTGDNLASVAPIDKAQIEKALCVEDKIGEPNLTSSPSEAAPISFVKDTSINKREKKQLEKKMEQEKTETHTKPSTPLKKTTRRRKRKVKTSYDELGISYEEEKMLSLAIKNSLREKNACSNQDYSKVKEMKTFYPSEEEFKDPIKYIETLFHEGAWKLGCIKIIPPASFKPGFSFNPPQDKRMPTRFQTLQDLSQGRSFDQNEDGISYSDFKVMAEEFQTKHYEPYQGLSHEERTKEMEKQYWKYVEDNQGERICVQYAADLSAKEFGSAFPSDPSDPYSSHPWNLTNMDRLKNSMLQICGGEKISGINLPWVYAGMLYSSFCWHYEDVMMYSINYMHTGEGKMWYAIPSQDRAKFERIAKEKLAILFDEDPNILLNITAMVSPAYLASNGVTVYKTEQRPGQFILTFPESYHAGWSTGFNVAEAVNIVMKSWLDYGLKSLNVYLKTREKVPVFSIDWIVVENIRSIAYGDEHDGPHVKFDDVMTLQVKGKPLRYNAKLDLWNFYVDNILAKELCERAMIRSHFNDKKSLFKTTIKKFPKEQVESKDNIECFYCIHLCYLSYVKCMRCKKIYCISHELQCGCPQERIKIFERYSDEQLMKFKEDSKRNILFSIEPAKDDEKVIIIDE